MPVPSICWNESTRNFECSNGIAALHYDGSPYDYQFELADAAEVQIRELRQALHLSQIGASTTKARNSDEHSNCFTVAYNAPQGPFRDDDGVEGYSAYDCYSLDDVDKLVVTLECDVGDHTYDDVLVMTRDLFAASGLSLVDSRIADGKYVGDTAVLGFNVPDELLVGEIASIAQSARRLASPDVMSSDDPVAQFAAIRQAHGDNLLGVVESISLDFKQQAYKFGNRSSGTVELAVDVAAFANGPSGGLIVLGAKTARDHLSRDRVVSVPGCDSGTVNLTAIGSVIHDRIYPPVRGLDVRGIDLTSGRSLVLILIPPQGTNNGPYVAAISTYDENAKIAATGFSIPYRRLDANRQLSLEEVHMAMRRGMGRDD